MAGPPNEQVRKELKTPLKVVIWFVFAFRVYLQWWGKNFQLKNVYNGLDHFHMQSVEVSIAYQTCRAVLFRKNRVFNTEN